MKLSRRSPLKMMVLFALSVTLEAGVGAEDPLKVEASTRSPSGKYALREAQSIQTEPGFKEERVVGERLILTDKNGAALSDCLLPENSFYDFEEGRFHSAVFWSGGESRIAINSRGRKWMTFDLFAIRGGQLTRLPEPDLYSLVERHVHAFNGTTELLSEFVRWVSEDEMEVRLFGTAYLMKNGRRSPPEQDDPTQDFDFLARLKVRMEGVDVLSVVDSQPKVGGP